MKLSRIPAFLMLVGSALFTQTTGVIVGRVVDSSGAGVPKVKIELVNQNTESCEFAELADEYQ